MYHTFQAGATNGSGEGDGGKPSRPAGSRRTSTSNACVECRRRKIRCDGVQPCGQCQWYQHPEMCHYAKPTQRVVPSRKLVDKLQSQIDQYRSVFARLFPGQSIEDFLAVSRPELVNRAITLPSPSGLSDHPFHGIQHLAAPTRQASDGAESLEALEQAPILDPSADEVRKLRGKGQAISDDVNSLSLVVDRSTSYVGISSVNAAMKVIFRSSPAIKSFISEMPTGTTGPSRSSTPPVPVQNPDPHCLPSPEQGGPLIDSYFAHIHCLMPMIDEQQFRNTYLYSSRRDSPWLALLNMVFALGSLASSTCDNEEHMVFYYRARKHLDAETFGSGSLYIVQALGLYGGYYLNWLNRPNEANGIMGATLRMATAHGLHREYSENVRASGGSAITSGSEVPAETRRKTWWSLYCLDSWASITTGRPSLGRTGTGITVQAPRIPQELNNAQYLESLRLLPLIHFIGFCKIATRAQDLLANHSRMTFNDLFLLDAELQKWHDDLPPILKDVLPGTQARARSSSTSQGLQHASPSEFTRVRTLSSASGSPFDFARTPDKKKTACPEALKNPRAIMHWRYQNLRMLMYRPFLLATSLRKISYAMMSPEERLAVSRCRTIAVETIDDIDATCQQNLIAGWNAVWMMYQAAMIPLVSLFSVLAIASSSDMVDSPRSLSEPGSTLQRDSDDDVDSWKRQIEKAIAFFDRMQPWSVAAKKSMNVVQKLYDVSNCVAQHQAQIMQQQQQQQDHRHQQYDQQDLMQGCQTHLQTQQAPFSATAMLDSGVDVRDMAYSAAGNPQDSDAVAWDQDWSIPFGDVAVDDFWDSMMWEAFPPSDPHDLNMLPEDLQQGAWWQFPIEQPVHPQWQGSNGF